MGVDGAVRIRTSTVSTGTVSISTVSISTVSTGTVSTSTVRGWYCGSDDDVNVGGGIIEGVFDEGDGGGGEWLIRIRTVLLFYTSGTSVRPVVRPTRDEPIFRDNGVPTVRSIWSPGPLSRDPGTGTPATDASPACRSARTRAHLHIQTYTCKFSDVLVNVVVV